MLLLGRGLPRRLGGKSAGLRVGTRRVAAVLRTVTGLSRVLRGLLCTRLTVV
ncbi:MAG: hypothetical protein QOG19_3505, partial [Mycobacterium sp.]|nr:hypothetical protein [Mycobacterium sp.]